MASVAIPAPARRPSPPWTRAPSSPPLPSAPSPAAAQRTRQRTRQAPQLAGAKAELRSQCAALQTEAGREVFVRNMLKWSSYADGKIHRGLAELGRVDLEIARLRVRAAAAGPGPATTEALRRAEAKLAEERERAEGRVAEAAIVKGTFDRAVELVRRGEWRGNEIALVLDTDEARCRLINAMVGI